MKREIYLLVFFAFGFQFSFGQRYIATVKPDSGGYSEAEATLFLSQVAVQLHVDATRLSIVRDNGRYGLFITPVTFGPGGNSGETGLVEITLEDIRRGYITWKLKDF